MAEEDYIMVGGERIATGKSKAPVGPPAAPERAPTAKPVPPPKLPGKRPVGRPKKGEGNADRYGHQTRIGGKAYNHLLEMAEASHRGPGAQVTLIIEEAYIRWSQPRS